MNCTEVDEIAGAYAVGALSDEEQRAVEAHLAGCERHAELASLRATALLIGRSVADREPPPDLRARILAAAATARDVPHEAEPPISLASRRRGSQLAGFAIAAVLAMVALAGVLSIRALNHPSSVLVRAVPAGPAAGTQLVVRPDNQTSALVVTGLDALPPGRTYQVWVIRGRDAPRGVGLFNAAQHAPAPVTLDALLAPGDIVAVTEEPRGGSPAPTSKPLFALTY